MKKKALLAALTAAALTATSNAAVVLTPVTDAISEGKTAAETVGALGIGVLGVFLVFKLIRRGISRLV